MVRRKRSLTRILAGAVLTVVSLALLGSVLVHVLAGRESTLRWVSAKIAENIPGISLKDVSGSLWPGPLRIRELTADNGKLRVEVRDLRAAWTPSVRNLFRKVVSLRLIHVESVTVRLPASTEPPRLPETLRLPFPAAVRRVHVRRIEIIRNGSRYVFGPVSGTIQSSSTSWTVRIFRGEGFGTVLSGKARIGTLPPFRISGQMGLASVRRGLFSFRIEATGNLKEARIDIRGKARSAECAGATTLSPFSSIPLVSAEATIRGLRPRQWYPSAPDADTDLSIHLEGQEDAGLLGSLRVTNRVPGTLDAGRVPVSSAAVGVRGNRNHLILNPVAIEAGEQATMHGKGSWYGKEGILRLSVQRLDLSRIHGFLGKTDMSGTAEVSFADGLLHADAALESGRPRASVRAQWDGNALDIQSLTLRTGEGRATVTGRLDPRPGKQSAITAVLEEFDPSRVAAVPQGYWNATARLSGVLSEGTADAVVTVRDTRLNDSISDVALDARVSALLKNNRVACSFFALTRSAAVRGKTVVLETEIKGTAEGAANRWEVRGNISGIPLSSFLEMAPSLPLSSSIRMDGRFGLLFGGRPLASLFLQRNAGDIHVRGFTGDIGVRRLTIDGVYTNGTVGACLALEAPDTGNLHLEATAEIRVPEGDAPAWERAPLRLQADADMDSIGWLSFLTGTDASLDGKIRVSMRAGGPIARPVVTGSATGTNLRFSWPSRDYDLKDGSFLADLAGTRLLLKDIRLRRDDAALEAQGEIDWASFPDIRYTFTLENPEILSPAGRKNEQPEK